MQYPDWKQTYHNLQLTILQAINIVYQIYIKIRFHLKSFALCVGIHSIHQQWETVPTKHAYIRNKYFDKLIFWWFFFGDLSLTEQSNKIYNRCPKCVPNEYSIRTHNNNIIEWIESVYCRLSGWLSIIWIQIMYPPQS